MLQVINEHIKNGSNLSIKLVPTLKAETLVSHIIIKRTFGVTA